MITFAEDIDMYALFMKSEINLTLPDGQQRTMPFGTTGMDFVRTLNARIGRAALAMMVNNEVWDLGRVLPDGVEVRVLTWEDDGGKAVFWHSTAHIFAEALLTLYPGAQLGIGPPIEEGFYYDVDLGDEKLRNEDLARVERKMEELLKLRTSFKRMEVGKEEALAFFRGKNVYKMELIESLGDGEITFYRQRDFVDLCKGPHLWDTGCIKCVKLLGVAGAYWRGDVHRKQLTRVYGISFPKKSMLRAYLEMREEAKKRDHRKLGRELGFFTFSEDVGVGLPLWLPKGAFVRETLVDYLRKKQTKAGYLPVITPHIGSQKLYKVSGHYEKYKESNFRPMATDKKDEVFLLKPMNCPHHCVIYKSSPRSYQDLPIALAEFGTVYRYEQHGELHGLTRVRGFTQDDAHIFCRPEQVKGQFMQVVDLVLEVFEDFGFTSYEVQVSLRDRSMPDRYIGDRVLWNMAESSIRDVVKEKGLNATIAYGEAAFYGPKLDFMVKDALGRVWQLGTVQIDYQLPERFDLTYVGSDNALHRPVMIHRAPFGSLERFLAILLEHTAGKLPVWLCPDQVMVLPISSTYVGYAQEVAQALERAGIRVQVDVRNEKVGRKIRDAEMNKIPYMLLVGQKEMANKEVSVRQQGEGEQGLMSVKAFVAMFGERYATK